MSWNLILSYLDMINWHTVSFYIIAVLLIASSLYVILTGHIVRSALSLIFSFLMVAGIYLLLMAEFIAITQVLIYAGAISVLIVFSIMLITKREENINKSSPFSNNVFPGTIVALLFCFVSTMIATSTSWNITYQEKSFSDINMIAQGFLNNHFVAFELAAVLLLVALVAAIFIIKEAKDDN